MKGLGVGLSRAPSIAEPKPSQSQGSGATVTLAPLCVLTHRVLKPPLPPKETESEKASDLPRVTQQVEEPAVE
jgi:hypothetical protein